ncbi:hypothetical protein J5N97_016092 [Dioscorea zingiberensis]|uniref:ENT domain-containing protein n=1 Tax=Dioscorea zingiberensis TaxID=325984 RepID=A0A9D5CKA4_9LILI|nr:hypothetical protein J5N97_016092 [Dioscorea zingiberensis]
MRIPSGPLTYGEDSADLESQIQLIEMGAYDAVLRAFRVQADDLSWGKETLLTELRRELRISDAKHREILGQINHDQLIMSLRNSHKANGAQQQTTMNSSCIDPNSMVCVSRKKLKSSNIPSSSIQYLPSVQPSQAHFKDDQLNCKDGMFFPQASIGRPMFHLDQNREASNIRRRKGSTVVPASKKDLMQSGIENIKPGSDIIQICSTDKLLLDVEKICEGYKTDPARLQEAKHILREHERALMDAIEKIAYLPDRDDSPSQMRVQYPIEEPYDNLGHQQFDRATGNAAGNAERLGTQCIDLEDDEYD